MACIAIWNNHLGQPNFYGPYENENAARAYCEANPFYVEHDFTFEPLGMPL